MTRALLGEDVARRINEWRPDTAIHHNDTDVWVSPAAILDVSRFLTSDPDLNFSFLNAITAVDYVEYFELVYHLVSMQNNTSVVIKSKVSGREDPSAPSVISVWQGADLQEREIWDLMGISFEGHPNLKRVLLWEGFPGHPLRKDFIE
ncbi:MAG: NADH-quinone oxidoreductase subunit C [SAR202 cluster bacterium]|jgi:NADH-quinone oxidoreductase subunit C|nr:NADH-quinone oxidoreductase subunit C [SAR202 cluster bacterium]MDP6512799.1 NADH-quinone oxidoreductase subunit C [SAR202 cluster bacterium]MDP6714382.1 NADH-quinone oxidoreductase subunit C [SAR202 cluster bacterium]